MKKQFLLTLIAVLLGGHMELAAQTGGSKTLIAYFSWSGNAKVLAQQIAAATQGDLFEIKTTTPYPLNYDECTKVAKEEISSNARPAISGKVANMEQYTTVFLCYPNWWRTMPMAAFTFLEAYNFEGKKIYPLVTHGSSRFGNSLEDIKKLCPKAVIGEGLSVSASDRNPKDAPVVTAPNKEVTAWLSSIGVTK